jgi:hypothetical protein
VWAFSAFSLGIDAEPFVVAVPDRPIDAHTDEHQRLGRKIEVA